MNPNPSVGHQVAAGGGGGGELIAAADARALLQFHEADHSSGSGSHEMEDGRYAAGDNEEIEMEGPSEPSNLGDPNRTVVPGAGAGNQLTLSFQGDVYVFDNVSPEKVTFFHLEACSERLRYQTQSDGG